MIRGKITWKICRSHIEVQGMPQQEENFPNHFLTDIQRAVVDKEVIRLEYFSNNDELTTARCGAYRIVLL